MCIIAIKKAGVPMIEDNIIKTMFTNNPDGAGYMYNLRGQVHIRKGFMSANSLLESLKKLEGEVELKNISLVIHCRIATSGKVNPGNTHPFPVSSDVKELQALEVACGVGVAHNGTIELQVSKGMSDTMLYIKNELIHLYNYVPKFCKSEELLKMIENRINSKMVFLDGEGNIYTIGKFIAENNMLYSNDSYEERKSILLDYWGGYWDKSDKGQNRSKKHQKQNKKLLMWIDQDLLIDKDQKLYEYDYLDDVAYDIDICIHDYKFESAKAEMFEVLPYKDYCEQY